MSFRAELRRFTVAAGAMLIALGAARASAQANNRCSMGGGGGGNRRAPVEPPPKYDGRFTFVRIAYSSFGGFRGGDPGWHHDYPRAERHLLKLITELTTIKGNLNESQVMTLTNPDLFKYPIAYLSEPGQWPLSEPEAVALRNYLKKGGFLIFDDFIGRDIENLIQNMDRVLPGMKLIELDTNHPVFDVFYRVKKLDYYHPYYCEKSEFYGIFEDNDPKKRLLAIVNQNNDIGEAWEWSDQGVFAIDVSNDAYKLGINYFIYALTR